MKIILAAYWMLYLPVLAVAAKSSPLARLPHTGKAPEGWFHPTYASVSDPQSSKARSVPGFLRGSVMYQLFTRMFTKEGTFSAAEKKLPELKELGIDIIYLTPHQLADDDGDRRFWSGRQKSSGMNNPKNPYRQKDFFAVDPEYGTKEDLKSFVDSAHRLGMKVMFDLVYFHCGPKAVFLEKHPDFIVRNPDGSPRLGDWAFPELDIANPAVREYLYANMVGFVKEYDVDGFRCDVADMVPVDFWEEGYRRCKAVKNDIFMMCEGLKGDDQIEAFDLSYGFYTQWTMVSFLKGESPAYVLERASKGESRDFPQGFHWMRCFENHDFANCKPGEKRKEELYGHDLNAAMIATCFMLNGIPMIYNGQEIADAQPHSIWSNRDHGGWGIDWSRSSDAIALERRALVKRLTKLRHEHPDLFDAPVLWHATSCPEKVYAFSRPLANGAVITLSVNISGESVSFEMPNGKTKVLKPHGFDIEETVGISETTFVVDDSPAYNAWPFIRSLNGGLFVVYSHTKGHVFSSGKVGCVRARQSFDGARTWSDPVVVEFDEPIADVWGPCGEESVQPGDALFWHRYWKGNTRWHTLVRTSDGKRFAAVAKPKLDPMPVEIKDPVEIPGRGLVSLWFAGDYHRQDGHSWGLVVSTDAGRTWTQQTVESGLRKFEWPTESTLLHLGGKRLMAIARCEQRCEGNPVRRLFSMTSDDLGYTWQRQLTNIGDVLESTPSALYDKASDMVTLYYFHRGPGLLKRRTANASEAFADPRAWSAPEIVACGRKMRDWDSGNVNAVRVGGSDYLAYYAGDENVSSVLVSVVGSGATPATSWEGRRILFLGIWPPEKVKSVAKARRCEAYAYATAKDAAVHHPAEAFSYVVLGNGATDSAASVRKVFPFVVISGLGDER